MKKTNLSAIAKTTLLSALVSQGISWANSPKVIDPVVSPILTINGFTFADLNKKWQIR
jgi:hypothetical protein